MLVQACPGKSAVRWTDRPAMTIAVAWEVKQQNKQTMNIAFDWHVKQQNKHATETVDIFNYRIIKLIVLIIQVSFTSW